MTRMTPERWKRIEGLYHEARAKPPADRAAFLAAACADDEAMRRNVESLLAESASDDGFLAKPPLPMPAHAGDRRRPHDRWPARPSAVISCETLLGAGGMGEVYRAHDSKLERDVAIKILPSAFTSHPDRLARFEREARMLAALNHPNICAIYGFEEADGIRFLILELVEGETLARDAGSQIEFTCKGTRPCRSIARCRSLDKSPTRSKSRTTKASFTAT